MTVRTMWLGLGTLACLALLGCGGAATNANRNTSRGVVVNTTEPITLRYAPSPGLRFRRTSHIDASLEGRHFLIEVVNDETLGTSIGEVTRRCVRARLVVEDQPLDVPCEGAEGSQGRAIIERLTALGALSVIRYPAEPIRVGQSWDCGGSSAGPCQWTLLSIEDTPAGRVARLQARAVTRFRDRPVPTEIIYTVRISDGVPLAAELHGEIPGFFSFRGSWTSDSFTN